MCNFILSLLKVKVKGFFSACAGGLVGYVRLFGYIFEGWYVGVRCRFRIRPRLGLVRLG